jgi:hypothetical protein
MSWDLKIWRGVTEHAGTAWKRICASDPSPRLQRIEWSELQAAVSDAFDGDIRISTRSIEGRGWEMSLDGDDKLVHISGSWGLATEVDFLRRVLRAARCLGASVFDPQTGGFWPDGEAVEPDPWCSVVLDEPDDDEPSVPVEGLPEFSLRVLPDRFDPARRRVIHRLSLTMTTTTARACVQLLVNRVHRFSRHGFAQQIQLDRAGIEPDTYETIVSCMANQDTDVVVPDGCVRPGVQLAFIGGFALDAVAALSKRLRRVVLHPGSIATAEDAFLATTFADMMVFAWVRRADLDVAHESVGAELTLLWQTLVQDTAHHDAEPPRIVNTGTGVEVTPAQVCSGRF